MYLEKNVSLFYVVSLMRNTVCRPKGERYLGENEEIGKRKSLEG